LLNAFRIPIRVIRIATFSSSCPYANGFPRSFSSRLSSNFCTFCIPFGHRPCTISDRSAVIGSGKRRRRIRSEPAMLSMAYFVSEPFRGARASAREVDVALLGVDVIEGDGCAEAAVASA
jgi:hypothetical protein